MLFFSGLFSSVSYVLSMTRVTVRQLELLELVWYVSEPLSLPTRVSARLFPPGTSQTYLVVLFALFYLRIASSSLTNIKTVCVMAGNGRRGTVRCLNV